MRKLNRFAFQDLDAAYQTAASSGNWEHLAAVLRDTIGGVYQNEEEAFSTAAQLLDNGYVVESEHSLREYGMGMR